MTDVDPGDRSEPVDLLTPAGGVPEPVSSPEGIRELARRLADADGPVAIDAERASGYRYFQRAQLVQLHRRGVGTVLIDPIPSGDLSPIGEVLRECEWVLHAASADLSCLAEVGMVPERLFDTELGSRIAGFERVSLGTMTQELLGLRLAKGHSAADWSIRPLPMDFLTYAALDVEVLLDLRDSVESELAKQGKLDWAHEEFEAVRTAQPAPPRVDPWRRLSGLSKLRSRRQYAIAKVLWQERDQLGQQLDIAPSRLLTDRAICAAAAAEPRSLQDMLEIDGFTRRGTIAHRRRWWAAISAAEQLPEKVLPSRTAPPDPNSGPSRWMGKDSDVSDRYSRSREVVLDFSSRLRIPPENLIPPQAIRSLAWEIPQPLDAEQVDRRMREYGARDWQRGLLAEPVTAALAQPPKPTPKPSGVEDGRADDTPAANG